MSPVSISSVTMIHEKQTRQFCAVHTVNNLLQIPLSGDDTAITWTCNGQRLHLHHSSWYKATQPEFDAIANEITLRERQLMNGDDDFFATIGNKSTAAGDDERSTCSLSIWQKIWSHHGTPYWGNYSMEVLQLALQRRGVGLDYFRVTREEEDAGAKKLDNTTTTTNVDGSSNIHLGYVIYEQGNSPSITTYLKRVGSYIPILKHFCQGMHWYAITRVRREDITGIDNETESNNNISWYHLIDSKSSDIPIFDSEERLMQLLRKIQDRGGLVFRASLLNQ